MCVTNLTSNPNVLPQIATFSKQKSFTSLSFESQGYWRYSLDVLLSLGAFKCTKIFFVKFYNKIFARISSEKKIKHNLETCLSKLYLKEWILYTYSHMLQQISETRDFLLSFTKSVFTRNPKPHPWLQ